MSEARSYLPSLFLNLVPIIPNFLILLTVCSTITLSLECFLLYFFSSFESSHFFLLFLNGSTDFTVGKSDRKSTRLNSSHPSISYAVFCLKKKKKQQTLSSLTHQ